MLELSKQLPSQHAQGEAGMANRCNILADSLEVISKFTVGLDVIIAEVHS